MRLSRIVARHLTILAALILSGVFMFAAGTPGAGAASGSAPTLHGTAMRPRFAPAKLVTNSLMTYHGGPVSTIPAAYISWWGSQWSSGFSTGGYASSQAQTYIKGFFGNLGGSAWHNIDTQYCKGVAKGTVNCGSSGQHVTNPTNEFKGDWVDTTAVPSSPTQTDIFNAAIRLMNHFGGYKYNAVYFVFTPTGRSMSGFGTQWCAWHDNGANGTHQVAYAYIPYMPDAGVNCGMNFVNATNNTYGNGYFDGFSIVAGHEYAEAETDMHPENSVAWQGPGGGSDENADKCAWNINGGKSKNILRGGHNYAIQPIWSNATTTSTGSHCVTSYP